MDKERITYLHSQFLNDSLSQKESDEWNTLLDGATTDSYLIELMDMNWDRIAEKDKIKLGDNRSTEIFEYILVQSHKRTSLRRLWTSISVAAAILITISAGLFYFSYQKTTKKTVSYATDIVPGKNSATLTLANGEKIFLSDDLKGVVAKEAGLSIIKTAKGQIIYNVVDLSPKVNHMNTLSTTKGETYQVRLPDGTLVWLNAASSLSYSTSLSERGIRKVKLVGEAYFEVAKDKVHPFVVSTDKQEIEVLGTHFNVNAYPDEPLSKTVLVEGSVKISTNEMSKILKPNQQASLSDKEIDIEIVDSKQAIAWKNGFFSFDNENLESVMRKISRWYNVDVQYDCPEAKNGVFFGDFSRFDSISLVLKTIERGGAVRFEIKGNIVKVIKTK